MVSFLKNFALGVVSQENKLADAGRTSAAQKADELRKAKLQFNYQNELAKNTANYQRDKEIDILNEKAAIDADKLDEQQANFQELVGGTMPGLSRGTPSIDNLDADPTEHSDDPVRNSLLLSYKSLASQGKFNEALTKRTELAKYDKQTELNDPTIKGTNTAKQLDAQAKAMREQGIAEDVVQSKVYGNKAKTIDPVFMRDLLKENRQLSNSYNQIKDYRSAFNTDQQAFSIWTQIGAKVAGVAKGLDVPDNIVNSISDPTQRQAVQRIITIRQSSINALKDAVADKGALSNQDRARAEAATAAFNTFSDPVAIDEAYKTLQDFIKDKLENNLEIMKDPTAKAATARTEELLYGKKITNPDNQPTEQTNGPIADPSPEQFKKMEDGTPYTWKGVTYIKGK